MATSGTVGSTTITCAQIIDHAFRRARIIPQLVTNEHLDVAKRLLWMLLTKINERGIALWVVDTQLVGLTYGLGDIVMPTGDVQMLNCNLRQLQRIPGTASASGGAPANAYDQDLTTSCIEGAPNGYIDIQFTQTSAMTQVGIMPAASGTWNFDLKVSANSGATFTTLQSVTTTVTAGTWLWYDVLGQPSINQFRLQATNGTTLAVYEIVCGNTPSDIPLAQVARDTWTQLPNKPFLGRPTEYYWDRRINAPILHIWPAPDTGYTINYLLACWVQRQLQDVGTLYQQVELPDRWVLPVIADLARQVAYEMKEATQDPMLLAAEADRLLTEAWNGETDNGPVRIAPNIGVYTA